MTWLAIAAALLAFNLWVLYARHHATRNPRPARRTHLKGDQP